MSFEDDPETNAIVSLIAGVASMLFVMFGQGTILGWVGVLGGGFAVAYGVRVLRGAAENKKLAVTGVVTGTIAVAFWLLIMVCSLGAALWQMI